MTFQRFYELCDQLQKARTATRRDVVLQKFDDILLGADLYGLEGRSPVFLEAVVRSKVCHVLLRVAATLPERNNSVSSSACRQALL